MFDPQDKGGSCPRCGHSDPQRELTAMAYGGFLGIRSEGPVLDEEDRIAARDIVETHPAWDVGRTKVWRLPQDWRLEWRRGEKVRWVNEGQPIDDDFDQRERYPLCPDCGKLLNKPDENKKTAKKNKATVDGLGEDPYGHVGKCPRKGQAIEPVALYYEGKVETLRLLFPYAGDAEDQKDLTSWAVTLGYSILAGARRYFALAEDDLQVIYEGLRDVKVGDRVVKQGILTFIDPNIGGSGYLPRLVESIGAVARSALEHLDHEDCLSACYRCLKSYRNQRLHSFLNWPVVTSTLEALTESVLEELPVTAADIDDPTPWLEAFAAGCQSPLEHKFLKAMEAQGLKPDKQHAIPATPGGTPFTVADFAFPEKRIAIYIDGAAYHKGKNLRRDRGIEARLQGMEPAWRVIRWKAKDLAGFMGSL